MQCNSRTQILLQISGCDFHGDCSYCYFYKNRTEVNAAPLLWISSERHKGFLLFLGHLLEECRKKEKRRARIDLN